MGLYQKDAFFLIQGHRTNLDMRNTLIRGGGYMFQSFLLVVALSIDSFLASLAYGAEKIRIPLRSALLISFIGIVFLGISLYTATFIQMFIPDYVCKWISFAIFFMIGISSIFQGTIKSFLRKSKQKQLTFCYSGISFVLDVYLDETKADVDHSKSLSLKEALYLAIALSIDSLVSGFALGISIIHPLPVLLISFLIGITAVLSGSFLGGKAGKMSHLDLSWLSGILFLFLACSRIL